MVNICPARPDDHPHFARLFPELGVDDPVLDAETWWSTQGATTLIAEVDGAVRGYLFFELPESTLYVRNVVSDPAARRTGIGRALLEAAIAIARARGAGRWCLNVKPDNAAAIALYESMGLRVAFETAVVRIRWEAVSAFPAAGGLEVRAPVAAEDAGIERALGLYGGQLRQQRERPGVVLLAAFAGQGEPVGLAAFHPRFPGAFPFRARGLEAATALLHQMAAHRVPEPSAAWGASEVQLVIEGDEALAEALRSVGGREVLRILHMNGPLPPPEVRGDGAPGRT